MQTIADAFLFVLKCIYMSDKVRELLEKTKGKIIGLFIDNANWFYPQKELGWRLSFSKLRRFLEKYYSVAVANVYAGTPLTQEDGGAFKSFKSAAEKSGYLVITKPLKKIWINHTKEEFIYKCNFDVEIAFDIARTIDRLDMVIIGSGDSDFLEAKNFTREQGKGFLVLCFERGVAWEMRKLHHIFLEELREEIQQ